MKSRIFIIILFHLSLSQSLDELIKTSLSNNPLLKSFDYKAKSFEKKAESETYLPDPNLETTYYPSEIVTANGAQLAQFGLNQPFPWFGTLSLKSDIIRKSSDFVKEQKKQFQIDLIQQISSNYYRLASFQAKDQVLLDYLKLLDSFYQSTLSRYENGNGLQQDILKVQTEMSKIKNRRIQLKSFEAKTIMQIRRLTYSKGDSIHATFPNDLFEEKSVDVKELHKVQVLLQLKEQSKLKQKLTAYKALPQFSIGLKYSLIDENMALSGNHDAFGISFGLSVPLWFGKYSNEGESYANQVSEIDQRILDMSTQIEETISYLNFDIQEKKRSLDLYKTELIPKAQLSLQASIVAYETGKLSFLNLLDAERTLLNLNLEEVETRKNYHVSISNYIKETSILKDGEKE